MMNEDAELYGTNLGEAQILTIISARTYDGEVYFDGVIIIPDYYSSYIYARDMVLRDKRLSWAGADYYDTITDLADDYDLDYLKGVRVDE